MKNVALALAALALSSCATSYQTAVKSSYMGNGLYDIRAAGNARTETDTIREFAVRKAYEECAEQGKGFKMAQPLEATKNFEYNIWTGMEGSEAYRMTISCEGTVDPILAKRYGSERQPASK